MDYFWIKDKDGNSVQHTIFTPVSSLASHRMSGENWYGFSPPEEPDPIGWCAWCDEEIYNEDHIIDGDIVCPACEEYWNSHEIAVDFIKRFFGSMPEIAQECKHDIWMEQFAEYMRECEPDMFKQLLKK